MADWNLPLVSLNKETMGRNARNGGIPTLKPDGDNIYY
jgi:hypothetical protein